VAVPLTSVQAVKGTDQNRGRSTVERTRRCSMRKLDKLVVMALSTCGGWNDRWVGRGVERGWSWWMSRCRHARDFAARSLTRTRRFLKSRLFQAGQFDVNLASELKIAISAG
jgi:hypothetical protein